jgi:uncharacterized protein (TIGR03067 family)
MVICGLFYDKTDSPSDRNTSSVQERTMARYFFMLLCCVCLCLSSSSSGADEKDDKAKAEVKKLQGTWQVTKWIDESGKDASDDETNRSSLVFKGDTVDIRHSKDGPKRAFPFKLDPTKNPKQIDIDMGPGLPVPMVEGIYKLEDDILTICIVSGGKSENFPKRPTEFQAKKGKFYSLFVMKRVKN